MAKEIIWTARAKREFLVILEYWVKRNMSHSFSIKLNGLVSEQLKVIAEFPEIGRITDISGVYIKFINSYALYYEVKGKVLYVLSIRHMKRNPETLKLK